MLTVNLTYIPGKDFEALGIVKGNIVRAESVRKDIFSTMSRLSKGEIPGYTEMLHEARQTATKRMVSEAENINADAIINVKYETAGVADGVVEVLAYGTAVRFR